MTREEAITILKDISWQMGSVKRWENIEAIDMAIEALSAERTGEWIQSYFNEYCGTDENHSPVFRKTPCVKCDQCGEKRRDEGNYCPNCGAKMGGDTE